MEWLIVFISLFATATVSSKRVSSCSCHRNDTSLLSLNCEFLEKASDVTVLKNALLSGPLWPAGMQGDVTFRSSAIDVIPDDVFSGLSILSFRCFDCTMERFPPNFFSSFGNSTESIAMYQSKMFQIDSSGFNRLPFDASLTALSFVGGQLPKVPSLAFSGLSGNKLNLNFHRIENLMFDDYALSGMSNVYKIEMAANSNVTLSPNLFTGLRSLRVLNMTGNGLEVLPQELFSSLIGLKKLYLAGNPWKCDSELQWVKRYIQENPHIDFDTGFTCVVSIITTTSHPISSTSQADSHVIEMEHKIERIAVRVMEYLQRIIECALNAISASTQTPNGLLNLLMIVKDCSLLNVMSILSIPMIDAFPVEILTRVLGF